ncbi:uncharacterized abhydrolase domain-containing protein DDB_G0269086-like [Manihot esculenta]|uniref:uncharacterized abhydrolase domain-containing protein DDB_G0269086-like n=1 Tax=Manihot esculenta TaxID=3983 RepID=UPI000B5D3E14|nr:uncharacterized abhydrolase domain-containing protein DDB_G0269086-like [Manihot esculenta]
MAPGGEARVILVDEDVGEVAGEDALVIRDILAKAAETKTAEDALPQKESSGVPEEVSGRMASKRPLHSDAPAPAPKKFRAPRRPDPALPPLEKKKNSVVPLLSASNNDILNAEDITHQSPASVVAEIIREWMFGGITAASDPRLLVLSGLLASSTQEQVAFRARSREDLRNTARELLLMVTGIFMEMDARDRALRESVDRRIEEVRLEENLSATSDAQGNLAAVQEDYRSLQFDLHTALKARKKAEGETAEAQKHAQSLEAELSHARRVLKESDERAAAAEVRCEEVLKQLSSTVDDLRERDEAVSQKEEVQRQHEQLKVKFDVVLAQKSEAVARVVVLKQDLSKQADSVKGLTLAAEESKLQNQQLCQQVKSLETRCSALLEEVKLAEDRVQLEVEKCLREYKESPELKKEIQQASEVYLQDYKNSLELKAEVAEACERRLAECLREARQAPSTPLAKLRAAEVDSDGEDVLYGEDDLPLPKGTSHTSAGPSDKDTELGEEDERAAKDIGPPELEIVPYTGDGRSEQEDTRPPTSNNADASVENSNVDSEIPRNVSPLRTIFPPIILDD